MLDALGSAVLLHLTRVREVTSAACSLASTVLVVVWTVLRFIGMLNIVGHGLFPPFQTSAVTVEIPREG
jgi:hypothetical protein